MHRKFGTDMPTTVDLRSAIEICDTLCQFALHYASQDPREMFDDSSNEDEQDPIHRANLQMIRNLNSTMLTGLQPSSRGLDGETPMEGSDTKQPRMPTMDEGEDDSDDEEIRFGKGLPSNELVHELAKAATSIFQMSVRIKAWVNMTPEQRELDEEINIIRGKRCLFMDGSTAMPFPSLDVYSQYGSKLYSQDGLNGMYNRRFNDPTAMSIPQGFRRPGDIGRMQLEHERDYSQNSTPFGSYRSTVSSHADSLSDMRGKSGVRIPGQDERDIGHQKYRKRAKRLHPPGRCQSCHTSDTPEWRRGPDGAGTLCNACGLQYAKLLKRQQQQRLQPLQDGQAGEADDEGSKVRMAQPLNFQMLKKPKPAAAATEPGATAPTS
ncbi:hypothetical protein BGX34_004899 [Mortierella sp. NVP85]|nr:hypothetical protein BGX34_004899 [Mortierella sp. NVP85]